ncbi:hypothetical protein ABXN37_22410 [Piscinibacter sakaiensis]|uniref:Uncharacterized protein n=1 Tax=Piscinibacter sakaiensis TaxID=1547922 RepID=A0A0K8P6N5_PISS1|nr:hypothetical protein [Piscinibacter sakaiensis]GAP37880.1 hypothetical protein ISF6_4074 [Piscinibacter sakaiensis]
MPIKIQNDGPELRATNYWDSEQAAAGLCYLTANAGTWRLLVPEAAEGALEEMRTGRSAIIEPSIHLPGRCWDVVFDDGSDSPFSIAVDRRQVDRPMIAGHCRLAVWTARGKQLDLACEVGP